MNSTRKAHGPHVKADTKVDITNVMNTQLVGSVFAGTPSQKINAIYDSSFDWLVLGT